MNDLEWQEIVWCIADHDRTRRPDGDELKQRVNTLRLQLGVSVPDVETGLARVREYYAAGGTWMKPMDLRPQVVKRAPSDQGVEGAYGGECPWPDCPCTHKYPCVKGWLDVDPDGFRPGEAARGAELRALASERWNPWNENGTLNGGAAMRGLMWAGGILRQEFGSPPPSGAAKVTPCPNCREQQHKILTDAGNTRDQALGKLRHRRAS